MGYENCKRMKKMKKMKFIFCVVVLFITADTIKYYATDGSTVKVTVVNQQISGSVELRKSTLNGAPLAGAEFTIFDTGNAEVGRIVTDKYGYGVASGLNSGDYFLYETKAPSGYQINEQVYKFSINSDGQVATVNSGKPIINLKEDEFELGHVVVKDMYGVGNRYELYDEDGNLIDTLVIDKDGVAISQALPYGKYKLVGPDGSYTFEISRGNLIQVYNFDKQPEQEQADETTVVGNIETSEITDNATPKPDLLTTGNSSNYLCLIYIVLGVGIIKFVNKARR